MFPTDDKSIPRDLVLSVNGNLRLLDVDKTGNFIKQHLYILSDEEIKDGRTNFYTHDPLNDKILHIDHIKYFGSGNNPENGRCAFVTKDGTLSGTFHKEVIATTDPKLIADGILPISEQFIKDEYIPAYNKYGKVDEVEVEYTNYQVQLSSRVASDGNYEGWCPHCKKYEHWMGTGGMTCERCYIPKINPDGSIVCSLPMENLLNSSLDKMDSLLDKMYELVNNINTNMIIKNTKDISKKNVSDNKPVFIKRDNNILGVVYRCPDIGKWVAVSTWKVLEDIPALESLSMFIKTCYDKGYELQLSGTIPPEHGEDASDWEDKYGTSNESSQKKSVEELAKEYEVMVNTKKHKRDHGHGASYNPENSLLIRNAFIAGYKAKEEELKKE